jgi:hypothetical protein
VKDIQKDLIENDPSKGSQTDMDTQKDDEDENDSFETIAPEKDNPVRKEFKIGELGNQELKKDERARDESGNNKPSQRQF